MGFFPTVINSLIGLMMMLLDILIEVSAPRFDFWLFKNDVIPLKNYIAWFVIGMFHIG